MIPHFDYQFKSNESIFFIELEDGDEPYSPGDSDDDDQNAIHKGVTATTTTKDTPLLTTTSNPVKLTQDKIQREMEELNRQIEAEKMEIALLHTAEIDEPYSPTNSVSPPITLADVSSMPASASASSNSNIPTLANISIPANLVDILKSISSVSSSTIEANQMSGTSAVVMNQYTTTGSIACTSETEYVPLVASSSSATTTTIYDPSIGGNDYATKSSNEGPSKLAQLTDEELLRLVPDDSLIALPPSKRPKYDDEEPLPPGIDSNEFIL